MSHKECNGCHTSKPATIEYFKTHKKNIDRLTNSCRDCLKRYERKRYARSQQKVQESAVVYVATIEALLQDAETEREKNNGSPRRAIGDTQAR